MEAFSFHCSSPFLSDVIGGSLVRLTPSKEFASFFFVKVKNYFCIVESLSFRVLESESD